jgi:hypothetical protein
MKIFETAQKQREYDGMWMLLGRVPDYENSYKHRGEDGKWTTLTPSTWIIMDVKSNKADLRSRKRTS